MALLYIVLGILAGGDAVCVWQWLPGHALHSSVCGSGSQAMLCTAQCVAVAPRPCSAQLSVSGSGSQAMLCTAQCVAVAPRPCSAQLSVWQ
ncbi:unnamed protein product, partial [Coccothraustes coccothraustes]